jgi:hypothetical protein
MRVALVYVDILSYCSLLNLAQESVFTQRLLDKPAAETAAAQQQEWPEIMSPTQRLSQVGSRRILRALRLILVTGPETFLSVQRGRAKQSMSLRIQLRPALARREQIVLSQWKLLL